MAAHPLSPSPPQLCPPAHTYIPEVCLSDLPEVVGSAQPLCKHPRVLGSEAEVDARHPVLDVVLGVKGGEVLAGRSASLGPLVSTFGLGRCGTAICNTHRDTHVNTHSFCHCHCNLCTYVHSAVYIRKYTQKLQLHRHPPILVVQCTTAYYH